MSDGAHPVRFLAQEEGYRSDAGGHDAPIASGAGLECRRMRREPAPAHRAGQAELVQLRWIVIFNALPQNLPLPGAGRDLKTLQLAQDLQQAAFAAELRAIGNMLPARQPAHE